MIKMDFHIHSDYSDDAETSVQEIIREAHVLGLSTIGIVDHIRKSADWLLERQDRTEKVLRLHSYNLEVFLGVEARLLDDQGAINLDPDVSGQVDFVVASIHRIPESAPSEARSGMPEALISWWGRAMLGTAKNELVDVSGHPDRFLAERGVSLPVNACKPLISSLSASRLFFEWNPASRYPDQVLVREMPANMADRVVFASDAHGLAELRSSHEHLAPNEQKLVENGNRMFADVLRRRRSARLMKRA